MMDITGMLQLSTSNYSNLSVAEQNESQNKKIVKEQEKQEKIFVLPNDDDVLGGRGNGVGRHPGNYNFRKLVKQYQPTYSNFATPSKKAAITMEIMDKVKSSGGRFLKPYENNDNVSGWIYMTLDESKKKVAQALRDSAPTVREQLKSSKQLEKDNHTTVSSNQFKAVHDYKTNMNYRDKINSKKLKDLTNEIDRIRGDMNELKRKYDQLDREHNELTRNLVIEITAGDQYENEMVPSKSLKYSK